MSKTADYFIEHPEQLPVGRALPNLSELMDLAKALRAKAADLSADAWGGDDPPDHDQGLAEGYVEAANMLDDLLKAAYKRNPRP